MGKWNGGENVLKSLYDFMMRIFFFVIALVAGYWTDWQVPQ